MQRGLKNELWRELIELRSQLLIERVVETTAHNNNNNNHHQRASELMNWKWASKDKLIELVEFGYKQQLCCPLVSLQRHFFKTLAQTVALESVNQFRRFAQSRAVARSSIMLDERPKRASAPIPKSRAKQTHWEHIWKQIRRNNSSCLMGAARTNLSGALLFCWLLV